VDIGNSCNECSKKMKPVFIQLADKLKDYGFVLGEVNAEESKALSAK
jgi:protein disulfide-isomerase A1